MEIFKLFGTIALKGGDTVKKGVEDVGKSLTDVGGKITSAGAKLSILTAGLGALAIQGIKYNSTVQDLETSFKVLLGSQEDALKLTKDLKRVGAETPFEITGLAEASKTLLAFGIQQKDLIPTMTKIGDVSLGNNEAFQSMARVMGQINALGKLQGGDLNQLINWGWNPLNEITAKTGETMEEVRKRMSEGKVTYEEVEQALIDATSAGGRFYKGMEEGSRTLSGKLSTLSDVFNELLGTATKPFFDFLAEKGIPFLTILIEQVSALDPDMKSLIGVFLGLVAAAGPLTVVLGGAVTAFGLFLSAIAAINLPIVIITGLIVGLIASIGGIGGAIVAMVIKSGKLSELKESFQKVKDVVTPIPELILAIFTNDHDKMMNLLITKFNLSREGTFMFIQKVQELRDKLGELAEKIGSKVVGKLKDLANKAYENRHEIGQFLDKVIDLGINLVDIADAKGPGFIKFCKDTVEALKPIVKWLKEVVDWTLEAIDNLAKVSKKETEVKQKSEGIGGFFKDIFGMPKFAGGTDFAPGGWSIVGEKGPELLNLPRGSKVFSASETNKILNQSSISNTNVNNSNTTIIEKVIINAKEIKELNDLVKMFSKENILLELNSM